jgi:hypothetical protein
MHGDDNIKFLNLCSSLLTKHALHYFHVISVVQPVKKYPFLFTYVQGDKYVVTL